MKHWFKDVHFRSLLKNSSYLAVSKGVAAVAGIATLAFAGRGLGLELFGMLILIISYAKAASGISQVPVVATDRPLWRTGAGNRRARGIQSLDRLCLGARRRQRDRRDDCAAYCCCLSSEAGSGITEQYLGMAMLYCTLLPTMGAATPVGVLRALDRFDLIGWQGTSYPIVRAILIGIAWANSAPLGVYLAIWFATDLGGDVYLWFLAWRELRRRGLIKGIKPTLRPATLPGAWRFAIHVNLTSSLTTLWGPIARLVVGGLLGPASARLVPRRF